MGIFVNALLVMPAIGQPGRIPFTEFIVPGVIHGSTVARMERHILERYNLQRKQYAEYGNGNAFPYENDFFVQGIPLIENVYDLIEPERIWDELIRLRQQSTGKETYVQRSFIARSDPALSAGMLAAQVAAVVALDRGLQYEQKTGEDIRVYGFNSMIMWP